MRPVGDRLIVTRDSDRRTVSVEGDVERLTGWDRATFARRLYAIVHPDDQRVLFDLSRRVRDRGEVHCRGDLRVVAPDGSIRGFHCEVESRLHDPDHRDLIAQLDPIDSPIVAGERHTGLLAVADDLVILQDGNLVTEYVSPSVERLLGYTADELVARWTEIVEPEDIEVFQRARRNVVGHPEGRARIRLRGRHADGSLRTFDMIIVNHLGDGVLDGLLLSGRDVTDQVVTERRLLATEARFEALIDNSPDVALLLDSDGTIDFCSAAIETLLGYQRDSVVGTNVADYIHPEDLALALDEIAKLAESRPGADQIIRVRRSDGSFAWIEVNGANRTDVPQLGALVLTLRDISDRVDAEQRMRRLTEVLEGTTDMVCIFDSDLEMIWANTSAADLLGDESRSLLDQSAPWARGIIERDVIAALRAEGSWRGELAVVSRHGHEIPTDATILTHRGAGGQIEFISAISRDMSERKALEARLSAKALQDPLTGLPNRTRLTERLDELTAAAAPFAIAFLDLDRFKNVNDTQGHDVGDQLLMAFARRLRTALRPADHVARFGGDEFVIILSDVQSPEIARQLIERVVEQVRGPMRLASSEVFITASAGVAMADGSDPATLVSNADTAMYEAKSRGRDQVALFSDELRVRSTERHETSQRLRRAIDDGEIDIWFQPIVDTVGMVPRSLEALARWHHPDLGVVPPARFISVAEESGLIVDLGTSLIRRTCAAVAELGATGDECTFSINLSPHQLLDRALPHIFETSLAKHGLTGDRLICEVTESAVMQDVTASAKMLDELRLLGMGVALDDFGTGYSSLAYLQRFPVDVVKIDREFIAGLSFSIEWDRSLVAGIISLAHSLGMTVVAEGVETVEQADILAMLGCDSMQGYLFSRPVPVAEVPETLARLNSSAD